MLAFLSYLPLLLFPVVILVAVFTLSARASAAENKPAPTPASPPPTTAEVPLPTAKELSGLSKEKLREMLARIEASPAPEGKMGAMCYTPMPTPDRAEYVCPKCGHKTLYTGRTETVGLITTTLSSARRLTSAIQKQTQAVTLLEKNFCNHCFPAKQSPSLGVRIRFADGTEKTTDNISGSDLRLLLGFFSWGLAQNATNGDSYPLKPSLLRLKLLLGEINEAGIQKIEEQEKLEKERLEKARETSYTIIAGDTGSRIAQKFDISLSDLQKLNPGVKWNRLQIGKKLIVRKPAEPTQKP